MLDRARRYAQQHITEYGRMHASRANRWLHVLALVLGWAAIALAIIASPWWLIAYPFTYVFAFVGHSIFEGNRPAFREHLATRGLAGLPSVPLMVAVEQLLVVAIGFQEIRRLLPSASPRPSSSFSSSKGEAR